MKEFKDLLRSRFADKRLSKQSVGALAISLLRKKSADPGEFRGYVKNNIVFLSLSSAEDKTMWFVEKKKYLAELNQELQTFGYKITLKDIRLVSGSARYG